jgi:hypothetical protein
MTGCIRASIDEIHLVGDVMQKSGKHRGVARPSCLPPQSRAPAAHLVRVSPSVRCVELGAKNPVLGLNDQSGTARPLGFRLNYLSLSRVRVHASCFGYNLGRGRDGLVRVF